MDRISKRKRIEDDDSTTNDYSTVVQEGMFKFLNHRRNKVNSKIEELKNDVLNLKRTYEHEKRRYHLIMKEWHGHDLKYGQHVIRKLVEIMNKYTYSLHLFFEYLNSVYISRTSNLNKFTEYIVDINRLLNDEYDYDSIVLPPEDLDKYCKSKDASFSDISVSHACLSFIRGYASLVTFSFKKGEEIPLYDVHLTLTSFDFKYPNEQMTIPVFYETMMRIRPIWNKNFEENKESILQTQRIPNDETFTFTR